MKLDTIIFDLDGTLLNTLDDLADSINYALAKCGYPKREKQKIRKWIGGGGDVLVRKAVPENTPEESILNCKAEFLEHYMKNKNNKTDLYGGIKDMIENLYQGHYKMGVVSTKGDEAVKQLIGSYFGEKIPVALGELPGVNKKPAPDSVIRAIEELGSFRESAIYVGDSEVDVATAKNAAIPGIIVTWGFRDKEELEILNPDYIVDTVDDLYKLILSLS